MQISNTTIVGIAKIVVIVGVFTLLALKAVTVKEAFGLYLFFGGGAGAVGNFLAADSKGDGK
jgi:hypothetical protein